MKADDSGTAGDEIRAGPIEQIEGSAKRFVLASIGAVAAACDTAEEQFDRFVSRGQRVQDEWQQRADDVRRQNAGARSRFGDFVRGAMDSFLNGVNVPDSPGHPTTPSRCKHPTGCRVCRVGSRRIGVRSPPPLPARKPVRSPANPWPRSTCRRQARTPKPLG